MIELSSAGAVARVELLGGRLSSLVVDGLEILVTEGEKPTRWGSFPMVPWCGRLAHGRLRFNGEDHDFPLTSPPHANHGTALRSTWVQTDFNEIEAALVEPWPFAGLVAQRFVLADDHLTIHMSVQAGDSAMPAQLGWHPWYRRNLDRGGPLELEFAAARMYVTDEEQLPTGATVPMPPGPWDDTFVDVSQAPILRWPGALTVRLTSNFEHWVVFNRPEHAVAIEPQSGAPNDLNSAPHVLQPGESLTGFMRLSWD